MAKFKDIVNYFRDDWKLSAFTIAASSVYEVVDLLVPYAIGQILNVLSNQPLDKPLEGAIATLSQLTNYPVSKLLSLGVLLGLIFLVTVVRAPTQPWLTSWFHWDIALRSRRDKTQSAIEKILTLPLEFYDVNNPGRIAGRLGRGLSNHTWKTYPEIAGQLIPKLFRVLGIFGFIVLIEWRIAIFYLISFVLILGFSLRQLKRIIWHESLLDKYMENTESRTSELITNIKTVKAFATESKELKRQKQRLDRELKVVDYRIHRGYVNLLTWQKTVIQFCVFTILGLTLAATVSGKVSLGHFVMTLTLSSMAYSELEPISTLAEVFARRYSSMLRFHEFLQEPTGYDAASLLEEDNTSSPYKFTGKVEFSGVSFGYDASRKVLQDINLFIEPYQTVALVGRSGSGKSTLVKLLLRYFEPQDGQILIDGQDIRTLNVGKYRRRLAIVHQEVDVFNGTVLDNLTYGRPEATFEEVKEACRIARVDEVMQHLPQGYYTVVGERGVRLSGGQRQRLGIARALLVEPDVLIFDEATSSLDYESERAIQLAMRSIQGTCTTIVIAHRLSTVREADKIVVLDQGKIVEVGNHDELLRQEGIYRRLHSLQETGELLD